MGLLYLTKRMEFSSSHFFHNPRWNQKENLARFGKEMNTHGHNFLLELTLEGEVDPLTGMVINTVEMKDLMTQLLVEFDHKHLNLDTPYFKDEIPSLENIARTLGILFKEQNKGVHLSRIRLYENEDHYSDYQPSKRVNAVEKKESLNARTYHFSSAHRLHSNYLSEEENRKTYGKCNNPNSHGHDYILEVTVKGASVPNAGSAETPDKLDRLVQKEIVDRYDHHYLDQDFEEFKEKVSTAENILVIIWNRLSPHLSGRLYKLKLIETRDNYFEYFG